MRGLVIALLLGLGGQTPTEVGSSPTVLWDQPAPSLADAKGYVYRYYLDGAVTGAVVIAPTCTGATSPYPCQATFTMTVPGPHTLTITVEQPTNPAARSAPSTPVAAFTVVFSGAPTPPDVVVPTTPPICPMPPCR